ncbi:MAG: carotenoid biosynthesis protein [Thermoprotei archaeon]
MTVTKTLSNKIKESDIISLAIITLTLIMILSDLISIFHLTTGWIFHSGAILLIPLLIVYGASIYGIKFLSKFFVTFFFGGLAIELLGTRIGIPFGIYKYTSKFQPQILGIPIQIPLGWFSLGIMSYSITYFTRFTKANKIITSSLLMLMWDILYDPIFTAYKIWIWKEGEYFNVPLTNFLGWFITSLLFFTIVELKTNHEINNRKSITKTAPILIYIAYAFDGGLQNIILNQLLASMVGISFMIIILFIIILKGNIFQTS